MKRTLFLIIISIIAGFLLLAGLSSKINAFMGSRGPLHELAEQADYVVIGTVSKGKPIREKEFDSYGNKVWTVPEGFFN